MLMILQWCRPRESLRVPVLLREVQGHKIPSRHGHSDRTGIGTYARGRLSERYECTKRAWLICANSMQSDGRTNQRHFGSWRCCMALARSRYFFTGRNDYDVRKHLLSAVWLYFRASTHKTQKLRIMSIYVFLSYNGLDVYSRCNSEILSIQSISKFDGDWTLFQRRHAIRSLPLNFVGINLDNTFYDAANVKL